MSLAAIQRSVLRMQAMHVWQEHCVWDADYINLC